MVRFFNQKEEVISIELTPYGKQQFAGGTFLPAYYAFYDTSILYDGMYAQIAETQNQIANRISNLTPRIRSNLKSTSTPGSVYSLITSNSRDEMAQNAAFSAPFMRTLGNSDPNSNYAPAWDISVLSLSDKGLNEGVTYNVDGMIPQMSATLDIQYETIGDDPVNYNLLDSDSLFLSVQELNTIMKSNGNFDIEVYKSGSDGQLTSLGFINTESRGGKTLSRQTDPYLLAYSINGQDKQINDTFPILNDTYSEYYLDISCDSEINLLDLPANSVLYKKNLDNRPQDPCAILEATLPFAYDT
jgi:hypothetical protein